MISAWSRRLKQAQFRRRSSQRRDTIGIVALAFLAADQSPGPVVTMTSTLSSTSSAARSGNRSGFPCISVLNASVLSFDIAELAQPLAKCSNRAEKKDSETGQPDKNPYPVNSCAWLLRRAGRREAKRQA